MKNKPINKSSAGKGDSPRSCFSKKYKDNYDLINWSKKKKENKIKKLLILPILLISSCSHFNKIELKGEITGTRYSNQPFTKGKHVISAIYPLTDRINIKGKIAQPYISHHSADVGMPDYGETGLEILF
jgi:hypothetical protein